MNVSLLGAAGVVGIIALLGSAETIAAYKHQKKCTLKLRGKCVALIPKDWVGDVQNAPYTPSYEIKFNGKPVIVTRAVGHHYGQIQIGQEYDLYVDPDNPQNFYNPDDNQQQKDRIKLAKLFLVIIVLLIIIGCIF